MQAPGDPADPNRPSHGSCWMAAGITSAILAAQSLWLILSGNNVGRAAYDATAYHLRFIRDLSAQFPQFDLSNPLTATTPGYHILLACFARMGVESTAGLRIVSLAIGCCFVGLVAAWLARRTGSALAAVLAFPLVCSVYVVGAAAWTVPDNLGWLLVVAIITLVLREPVRPRDLLLASALLVPLVLVRQIHIWAAAVVWIGGWKLAEQRRGGPIARSSVAAVAPWLVATLPAFGVLFAFMRYWGGLTPPRFQSEVEAISPATPAFILLQIAILSVGFLPWIAPLVAERWRANRAIMLGAAGSALVVSVIPKTTASFAEGRFSGWWVLAEKGPVVAGHTSIAVVVGACAGAVVLAALLLSLRTRDRVVIGGALLAFTAALTSNFYCWQRYHEPLLLFTIPACCAMCGGGAPRLRPLHLVFPVALAALLSAITLVSVRGAQVPEDALPAPQHFAPSDPFFGGSPSAR